MKHEWIIELTKAIDSTDWISNVIQILLGVISIIAPMIFAYWVSKKDTKEIDERQKRLEDNIKLLSEYQGKNRRCFNLTLFISKKVLQ
ncbi:Uncharacterised protein [Streptococcus criceti]|uniref:Uncharacterized protein n=1 Tax=Streptococcus criceti HS-6 TaxID=873449 RepID=G5JR07_STRCG|nr:hypothetical protein [Streptococcus criceti]EHI75300.1 hypothetical protein STRCR_1890 [Streptococcus criceti HS-6]SUN43015.1 Uncharacterised protein [Streptococcus criceti]